MKANVVIWWNLAGQEFEIEDPQGEPDVRRRVLTMCQEVQAVFDALLTGKHDKLKNRDLGHTADRIVLRPHVDDTLRACFDEIKVTRQEYALIKDKVANKFEGLNVPPDEGSGSPDEAVVLFAHEEIPFGDPKPYYYRDEDGKVICVYDDALVVGGEVARLRSGSIEGVANVLVSVEFEPF